MMKNFLDRLGITLGHFGVQVLRYGVVAIISFRSTKVEFQIKKVKSNLERFSLTTGNFPKSKHF